MTKHQPSTSGIPSEILRVEELSFAYDLEIVLENINLTVKEGEFVSMLGSSGSGKTTLLRLLAGLEPPSTGKVLWEGQEVTGPSLQRGIVFQEYSLFPWLTLSDNVALAVSKTSPETDKLKVKVLAESYLEMVGLRPASKKYPHELSGGMRQRGAIARTIALGSPLLLMDEPFGALDPVNRIHLQELLLDIWSSSQKRRTIIFVTHDVDEALYLGDRVIVLGSGPGRIIADIPINHQRPRLSDEFYTSEVFKTARDEIHTLYRRDARQRLNSKSVLSYPGDGI